MATLPNSKKVTCEEWLRMPEVLEGTEEVVNGEIHIMPAPRLVYTLIVKNLYDALAMQLDRREIWVFASQFGLIVRKHPLTSRVPDLAVFGRSTVIEEDGYIHSAPQLFIEVLSPANTRRERQGKLDDCAALGVPEAWVVAPEGRTVEILLLSDGQLRRSAILAEGMLKPTLIPHVQVDIAQIWPD
jgi:Uma2 family endonuclease